MRGGSVCVKCSPFDGRRRVTRIEQVQTKGEGEGGGKGGSFCDNVIIGCPQSFHQFFLRLQGFCINEA